MFSISVACAASALAWLFKPALFLTLPGALLTIAVSLQQSCCIWALPSEPFLCAAAPNVQSASAAANATYESKTAHIVSDFDRVAISATRRRR